MSYRYARQATLPPDVEDTGWEFELEQSVMLTMTGETGFVVGRKESLYDQDQYEILYVNAACCLTRQWWPEGAIEPVILNA